MLIAGCSLGFCPLQGKPVADLARDFAQAPLTCLAIGRRASRRVDPHLRVSIGPQHRIDPCRDESRPSANAAFMGFSCPYFPTHSGQPDIRAMGSPHIASHVAADRPMICESGVVLTAVAWERLWHQAIATSTSQGELTPGKARRKDVFCLTCCETLRVLCELQTSFSSCETYRVTRFAKIFSAKSLVHRLFTACSQGGEMRSQQSRRMAVGVSCSAVFVATAG